MLTVVCVIAVLTVCWCDSGADGGVCADSGVCDTSADGGVCDSGADGGVCDSGADGGVCVQACSVPQPLWVSSCCGTWTVD